MSSIDAGEDERKKNVSISKFEFQVNSKKERPRSSSFQGVGSSLETCAEVLWSIVDEAR